MRSSILEKQGERPKMLVYSQPYKSEWPVLFLSRLEKYPFQLRDIINILKVNTNCFF